MRATGIAKRTPTATRVWLLQHVREDESTPDSKRSSYSPADPA
jgi:hypothetical protein